MLNPTTRQFLETQTKDQIFAFVETLIAQRDRAELLAQAYLHEIKILKTRTDTILKPLLEKDTKPLEDIKPPNPTKPISKPKTQIKAQTVLNLGIQL